MIFALALAVTIAIPPRPTGYVTDDARALSAPVALQIRNELRSYETMTKHHVIVWIGQTTADTPLEDWTIHAAEKWKIGRKGVDDGAILFLFMRDHKVRIEVGYGLESALTDAGAGQIIRETIVPKMRSGDTDGAVQAGVNRILVTITPSFAAHIHEVPARSAYAPGPTQSVFAIGFLFFFLLVFFGFFAVVLIASKIGSKSRGAWYGGDSSFASSSGGGSSDSGGSSGSSGGSFGGGGASGSW